MRIVIVDDDKLVCASLKTILEQDEDISVARSDITVRRQLLFTIA